jgi:signal transduction histidine kinase
MIDRRGIRTRVLLIAAMAAIIVCTTLVSLLTIRHRLQQVVIANLSADLLRSIGTFEDLQVRRRAALDRENALLADLPTLKALMTTSDERTIQDAGAEFWKVSGNDLFALANNEKRVVAAYAMGLSIPGLASDLEPLLDSPKHTYVITNNRLFACSVQPLYFGSKASGTLLGYVISGYSIDRGAVSALSRTTGVEAIFRVGNRTIASSVPSAIEERVASTHLPPSESNAAPVPMMLGNERYLLVTRDLSASASSPLELIELKSLDQEERSIREIDGLVLTAGLVALLLGTILMTALSRLVTRPLEQLDAGVQAFAAGNSAHILPYRGTAEVRELSAAFARMRQEILQANQALLESERLATIGRMANSVSHDLRHYLAAVYANSEFLASGRLSDEERNEILGEIRTAVDGTTELLESLLIFSRSGPGIRRSHQLVATLVDRAVAMAHAHPDAAHVQFSVQNWEASETAAIVDGKQIERALYNLLLNACQTLHTTELGPKVGIAVDVRSSIILLEVKDNGDGVPEGIRSTLFDPFVSEGKQKGSGLGLTLAQCIAREHGGDVTLVSSRPGETIFRMTVARGLIETAVVTADDRKKVRTI